MKWWTASLGSATFILPMFGAAITRSTLVPSVHTFGGSATGLYFAGFGLLLAAGTATLLVARRGTLRSAPTTDRLASRESATLLGGIALSVMAAAVLAGTMVPVVSGLIGPAPVSVGISYYSRAITPLALSLVALMAISPLLVYGGINPPRAAVPLVAGVATVAALLALAAGVLRPTVFLCIALLVLVVVATAADLLRSAGTFARTSGYGFVQAAARVIDGNHRRYGGQLAHVGIAILVVGVAGSGLQTRTTTATISPGQTLTVSDRTLRLDSLTQIRADDFTAVEAAMVELGPGGPVASLRPQRRFYDDAGDAAPRAALLSGWREDLTVSLVGWEARGTAATIQARVNPLMLWVWIGAAAAALGGVFCLFPRLIPRDRGVSLPPLPVPPPMAAVQRAIASRPVQPPAVRARGLCAQIDERWPISGIDLDLLPGTFTAVLGANGAGKTTLLRLMATLIEPTRGTLEILTSPHPEARAARTRIGYIGHQLMLYRDLSVLDNLAFFARLYRLPNPRQRALDIIARIGLSGRAHDPVRDLSRGQAQRVAVARALLHEPDLLLADEPFTGLDSQWTSWLRHELSAMHRRGVTIVLTHHDARDLPGLASRVLVLEVGRIASDGPCPASAPGTISAELEGRP